MARNLGPLLSDSFSNYENKSAPMLVVLIALLLVLAHLICQTRNGIGVLTPDSKIDNSLNLF